jgi:hypothetical protein
VDQSRVARGRKSMTPLPVGLEPVAHERIGRGQENKPFEKGRRDTDRQEFKSGRKERSLSPYSKRIALTQAMNIGR